MDWHLEAMQMYQRGMKPRDMAPLLCHYFPADHNILRVKDSIRKYIQNTDEYKARHSTIAPGGGDLSDCTIEAEKPTEQYKSSVEYKQDGSIISTKFLKLQNGEKLTPEELLTLHGLDPCLWEVTHCINNFWNSQLTGGILQISYQSKLTAKPKKQGLSFAEIDAHFAEMDREHITPEIAYRTHEGHMMAEVNIADLHLGKLCWHGDTPENYDYKIAQDLFYRLISEICGQLRDKPLDYILFVWSHDFFNCDTITQTTTAGTPQDVDVRWQKLFNVGCDMLVKGIEMLMQIASVKTFYIPSNHDEMTGYHAMKYIQAWFRHDENVEVIQNAQPRFYHVYGENLIGFTHGDTEKANRLSALMPNEARQQWGVTQYHELHCGHLHSERATEELNGVIVRRIASPTATDTWHNKSGYIGAVRKAQTFIWDKDNGLMQTINTPVEREIVN